MSIRPELSRRAFTTLAAGLVTLGLPRSLWGQSADYANPGLLTDPEALRGAVPPAAGTLVVVDLRPRAEYEAGHIAGAVHLDPNAVVAPHSPVEGALRAVPEIEAMLGALGIGADRRVVFYDDRGGLHAARMLWLMEYLGHRNVSVLNGGWTAWQETGGAVSTVPATPVPAILQAALSPRRHASAEDVLAHRDVPGAVLIDVRPTPAFDAGHIPWAVNVPWAQNLGEDGRFLPAAALMAHFDAHGVTRESPVIMHCQSGLASSHSYVALRLLGLAQIRVYHRSWAEWGSDPALPKVAS